MLNELMKLSDCVVKENDEDLIEFVNKNLANIPAYFNNVVKYCTDARLLSSTFKFHNPDKYVELKENYELERRSSHINMTDSINKINRLCDSYEIQRVFETGKDRDLYSDTKDGKIPEFLAIEDRSLAADLGKEFLLTALMTNEQVKKYENSKDFLTSIVEDNVKITPLEINEIGFDRWN